MLKVRKETARKLAVEMEYHQPDAYPANGRRGIVASISAPEEMMVLTTEEVDAAEEVCVLFREYEYYRSCEGVHPISPRDTVFLLVNNTLEPVTHFCNGRWDRAVFNDWLTKRYRDRHERG